MTGIEARYVHTNLIARDWRTLARFYVDVFGCTVRPPERNLSGEWLSRSSGVPDAHLEGVHLELPGFPPGGPTLEVYSFAGGEDEPPAPAHRRGLRHLAFHVADVRTALEAIVEHGGYRLGEVERHTIEGSGEIEVVYARDPEGNIVELQHWD